MVVIALPAACLTAVVQERATLPSISTLHAPHCPRPQPNLGPCSPSALRNMYRSGCPGSQESTVTAFPFTRKLYFGIRSPWPATILPIPRESQAAKTFPLYNGENLQKQKDSFGGLYKVACS